MRHRKAGVKLGRNSSHRKAMFRNMVTSLFKYDRIRTTDAKAKELRGWADHIITLAKRGDLHARRQALSIIREQAVVHRVFDEARERFGNIDGGYTRIIKIGTRAGDAAPMSMIELVAADKSGKPKAGKVAPVEAVEKPIVETEAVAEAAEAAPADVAPASLETEAAGDSEEGTASTETKTEEK